MKGKFYKTAFIQLGIFLAYDLLLFYTGSTFLLLFAILLHAIFLLIFAVIYFRKKETRRALAFVVPLLVVLLIGMGSCGGIFADMGASTFERMKLRRDSAQLHRLQKHGDTARNMGTDPNTHKGQKESGIPRGRYKWVKRGKR